jgi:hypothetical protein
MPALLSAPVSLHSWGGGADTGDEFELHSQEIVTSDSFLLFAPSPARPIPVICSGQSISKTAQRLSLPTTSEISEHLPEIPPSIPGRRLEHGVGRLFFLQAASTTTSATNNNEKTKLQVHPTDHCDTHSSPTRAF